MMKKLKSQDILQEWGNVDRSLLPTFTIMGAMKAGTTSLYHYMDEHPDIYFPKIKEPGIFLNYDGHAQKMQYIGTPIKSRQDAFAQLMEDYQGQTHIGDASVFYSKVPFQGMGVPTRIKLLQPSMKFIYVLRHPIDRIISHYLHNCFYFEQVRQIEFNEYLVLKQKNLLSTSLYFYQLSQFLQCFDLSAFLIITSEDLKSNPKQIMQQVFEFLSVDAQFQCQNLTVQYNTTVNNNIDIDIAKPKFTKPLYQQVSTLIKQDVQKLEFLLSRKFNWDFSEQNYI